MNTAHIIPFPVHRIGSTPPGDFSPRSDMERFRALAEELDDLDEMARQMRGLCQKILREADSLGLCRESIHHPLCHVETLAAMCKLVLSYAAVNELVAEGVAWPR